MLLHLFWVCLLAEKGGEKGLVIVDGVLVQSTLPSKSLLERRFDEVYRDTRVGDKFVSLVRGYFLNRLGVLARKYYCEVLPKFAVRIAEGLYLVPMARLVDFEGEVEKLRGLYEKYERELRDFFLHGKVPEDVSKRAHLHEEYKELVLDYIARLTGEEKVEVEVPSITDRVRIRLFPLRIDPSLWEKHVDESLRRRKAELVRRLEEDLERARREAVQTAQAEIKRRILELNASVVKALSQLKRRGRIHKATGKKLSRMLKEIRESNLFRDPEISRMVEAYEGLTRAIESEAAGERVEERPAKFIKEIGKVGEVEVKTEEKEEMLQVDDYRDVFRELAESVNVKLETKKAEIIPELQEVDREFVEALGKLTEAISI